MKNATNNLKALTINPSKAINGNKYDENSEEKPVKNPKTGSFYTNPITGETVKRKAILRDSNDKPLYNKHIIKLTFEGNVVDSVNNSSITLDQLAKLSKAYADADRDLIFSETDKQGNPITHYVTENAYYKEDSDITCATFKAPFIPKPAPKVNIFATSKA